MSDDPQAVYLRQPFLSTSAFHLPLLALLSLGLVAAFILIPGAAIARRGRVTASLDGEARAARLLVWVTSAIELFFLGALFAVFTDPGVIYGVPGSVRWVFWLPIAAIPGILAAAVLLARAWIQSPARPARLVLLSAAVAGQAGLIAWLSYWNVLFYALSLAR